MSFPQVPVFESEASVSQLRSFFQTGDRIVCDLDKALNSAGSSAVASPASSVFGDQAKADSIPSTMAYPESLFDDEGFPEVKTAQMFGQPDMQMQIGTPMKDNGSGSGSTFVPIDPCSRRRKLNIKTSVAASNTKKPSSKDSSKSTKQDPSEDIHRACVKKTSSGRVELTAFTTTTNKRIHVKTVETKHYGDAALGNITKLRELINAGGMTKASALEAFSKMGK